ncbi:hypothetical protein ACOMHN_021710 [Nucella lapillus]
MGGGEICIEGRYDSAVGMAEASMPTGPWRQKSLDEKKLRFVMKRSSMPAQISSSNYINHGVMCNHKAASTSTPVHGQDATLMKLKKKSPLLMKGHHPSPQQQRMYVDDFSDFDCLLEAEEKEAGKTNGGGRTKDGECQTGEELVQAMFLQLRRRRFHTSATTSNTTTTNIPSPQHPQHHHHPTTLELGVVKEVTFSTHPVPVHRAVTWSSGQEEDEEEEEVEGDLWGGGRGRGGGGGRGGHRGDAPLPPRRLSDLSSLSYADGVSTPDTPCHESQQQRRSSDTSDMSSPHSAGSASQPHHHHHTVYHRPPTPRTPRRLLIQNNNSHHDLPTTADGKVPPS